jgi:hypothetical protein
MVNSWYVIYTSVVQKKSVKMTANPPVKVVYHGEVQYAVWNTL